MPDVQRGDRRRHAGARRQGKNLEPRIGEHAGYLAGPRGVNPPVLVITMLLLADYLTLEDHHQPVGYGTFFRQSLTGLVVLHFHTSGKPFEIAVTEIGEDRNALEPGCEGGGLEGSHVRPSPDNCGRTGWRSILRPLPTPRV